GRSWPTGIGRMAFSLWLKMPTSASASTLYLPSLIDEVAYMTTKKANIRVMKSAKDTSQRSLLGSSSCWRLRRRRISDQKAFQLVLDRARVLALGDGQHALNEHFAVAGLHSHQGLELVGQRQQQQVGETHAVDGGDEGHGDAGAQLRRIGEVAHHLDQAEYRADDANGRRIAAHGLV